MANSYKYEKEAFVSNLSGGTISEINSVTLIAPVSILVWSALQSRQDFFSPYTPIACLVDFLLNCAAILSATTIYASNSYILGALLGAPALALLTTSPEFKKRKVIRQKSSSSGNDTAKPRQPIPDLLPVKPFVTHYRGTMMVVTCVAILAVDFKIFPRRFAKVENWGTSLMDLGVGSFVFSAGTVAARPILKLKLSNGTRTIGSRLHAAARHALPLFVLGLVRLYSVKGLDYAEHVTEYGVHWNFFFTMAFVPPFVALFDWVFDFVPSYSALALLIAVLYETVLDFTTLKSFIMTAPRTDLLSKNREGVFSFWGYLAIFLAGQAAGMQVLPRPLPHKGQFLDSVLKKLLTWSAVWSLLFTASMSYSFGLNLHVSRRLANLPYMLWIAAFNTWQLTIFYAIEKFCFPHLEDGADSSAERANVSAATSTVLRAFNRNGLALFLAANLLTGLVNMTMPTLHMNDLSAMAVLLAYTATLSGLALILDAKNILIKL